MLLECLAQLTQIDTRDIEAAQAVVDSCLTAILDPSLWIWATVITAICSGVGALIGWAKGRTVAGLVWGTVLGPIGWIVIALWKSKLPECPQCGRPNSESAKICRHCGTDFRKHAQRTVRSGLKADNTSGGW